MKVKTDEKYQAVIIELSGTWLAATMQPFFVTNFTNSLSKRRKILWLI
jgi:hypothetical protein